MDRRSPPLGQSRAAISGSSWPSPARSSFPRPGAAVPWRSWERGAEVRRLEGEPPARPAHPYSDPPDRLPGPACAPPVCLGHFHFLAPGPFSCPRVRKPARTDVGRRAGWGGRRGPGSVTSVSKTQLPPTPAVSTRKGPPSHRRWELRLPSQGTLSNSVGGKADLTGPQRPATAADQRHDGSQVVRRPERRATDQRAHGERSAGGRMDSG